MFGEASSRRSECRRRWWRGTRGRGASRCAPSRRGARGTPRREDAGSRGTRDPPRRRRPLGSARTSDRIGCRHASRPSGGGGPRGGRGFEGTRGRARRRQACGVALQPLHAPAEAVQGAVEGVHDATDRSADEATIVGTRRRRRFGGETRTPGGGGGGCRASSRHRARRARSSSVRERRGSTNGSPWDVHASSPREPSKHFTIGRVSFPAAARRTARRATNSCSRSGYGRHRRRFSQPQA